MPKNSSDSDDEFYDCDAEFPSRFYAVAPVTGIMSVVPEDPNSVRDDGPFLGATPGPATTITAQPFGSTKGECSSATTVVAAERPDPPKSNNAIPQYDGKEAFPTWLRRTRFYLEDVPRAEQLRTLLKSLAPPQLDKALDAWLHAGLPLETLCQQLANIYGQTGSVGDAIEKIYSRLPHPGRRG
nr:unnamed protein product [Spirometra erinaceieuropaei]